MPKRSNAKQNTNKPAKATSRVLPPWVGRVILLASIFLIISGLVMHTLDPETDTGMSVAAFGGFGFLVSVVVIQFVRVALGLTANSALEDNKITFTPRKEGNTYSTEVVFHDPSSFRNYAVVYDPKDVNFDQYSIRASYKRWNNPMIPFGRQSSQLAQPLPGDPSKRIIYVLNNYTRPSRSDNKYLNFISLQFFYNKKEVTHSEALQKFNAIRNKMEFRVYNAQGGYSLVQKHGDSWNVQPGIHNA